MAKAKTRFTQEDFQPERFEDLIAELEQHSGAIRTVLIGLGGTGSQVLLRVRRRFYERNMKLEYAPLAYVAIDTLAEAESLEGAGEYMQSRTDFSTDEYVRASVTAEQVRDYLERRQQFPAVCDWLPAQLPTSHIDDGAGACRPAGRLAFYHNYDRIKDAIDAAVAKVTSPRVAQECNAHATRRQFIVVCSLAGGTGTGMFLDMGLLLMTHWSEFDSRVGVFVLPGVFDRKDENKHKVNTYAALKEFELFQSKEPADGRFLQYHFPGEDLRDKPLSVSLYRFAYLVGNKNEADSTLTPNEPSDRLSLFEVIAETIFWDITESSLSDHKRMIRFNLDATRLSNGFAHDLIGEDGRSRYSDVFCTRYMGLGATKLEIPIERLLERAAYRRSLDIVEYWLRVKPLPDPKEQAVTRLISTSKLNSKRVRDALAKVSRGGQRLGTLIREWLPRARSEARARAGGTGAQGASTYLAEALRRDEREWFDAADADGTRTLTFDFRPLRTELEAELGRDSNALVSALLRDRDRGARQAAEVLGTLAKLLNRQIEIQTQKVRDKESHLNGAARRAWEAAYEQLHYVEEQWRLHPLRNRSFPILTERAARAARLVLQLRLDAEIEAAAQQVFVNLRDRVERVHQEVDRLIDLLEHMRTKLKSDLKKLQQIQPAKSLFDEVSVNQEEESFYARVREALRGGSSEVEQLAGESRAFLREIGTDTERLDEDGQERGELPLLILNRRAEEGRSAASLNLALLRRCHETAKEVELQVSSHIMEYTENGQLWWRQRIGTIATNATAWVPKSRKYTGQADKAVGGFILLGIEPNPYNDQFKQELNKSLRQFTNQPIGEVSNRRLHSAVLLREIGGFPLLYLDGMSDWHYAYHHPELNWPVHLAPHFAELKDLLLMSPEDFDELHDIYSSLLVGTMLGLVSRTRADDGPHFQIMQEQFGQLLPRDLGIERDAVKRLRKAFDKSGLRPRLSRQITDRVDALTRHEREQLLKVVAHYGRQVCPIRAGSDGKERRTVANDVLEQWYRRLCQELDCSPGQAQELIDLGQQVPEFTTDPCEDGWRVIASGHG